LRKPNKDIANWLGKPHRDIANWLGKPKRYSKLAGETPEIYQTGWGNPIEI
jgi:hypothetical protein